MEHISIFLSVTKQIADQVANCEKTKKEDKNNLLNNIIKPLYTKLKPVARNYMKFFQEADLLISISSKRSITKNNSVVKNNRENLQLARIKVHEMANQLKENIQDENVSKFANAISVFFNYAPDIAIPDLLSLHPTGRLAVLVEWMSENKMEKSDVIRFIDETYSKLEESWKAIVQMYEKMEIDALSESKFTRKGS